MYSQNTGYPPYPKQEGVPPPGFYPQGGAPYVASGYPGAAPFPAAGGYPGAYPGGGGYYPGAAPYPSTAPGYSYPQQNTNYSGAGTNSGLGFSDKSIRMGFIRKVYSILMVQLIITLLIIAILVFHQPTKYYFRKNPQWVLIAFVVTIVTMLAMACCESARRTAPTNYIFLGLFTIAEGFLCGVISSTYEITEVILAVGLCALICFGLTVFAFQTKIDFTVYGGILFVAVLILFVFGLVLMFFPGVKFVRVLYSGLGAFIFAIYLIYDTQMMMGGNHKYSISPEEYVFAALSIYIDIVQLFLHILSLIGETSRD